MTCEADVKARSYSETVWKPALAKAGLIATPVRDRRSRRRYVTTRKEGIHQLRHYYASVMQMSRIAFDASFGRLREHALPAAQRATLRPPGPPECRPATVTWGFMVCLDLMQR